MEFTQWLSDFECRHGRRPRILHIGNIANNAYRNATLLERAGFDCDVLCYDYYHIMGCPEWDDADFKGMIEDHFFPDWRTVDLNSFERPRWFAQGPLETCLDYLIAKWSGDPRLAAEFRDQLTLHNKVPGDAGKSGQPKESHTSGKRPVLIQLWESRLQEIITLVERRLDFNRPHSLTSTPELGEEDAFSFQDHCAFLQREFALAFPDRKDRLQIEDMIPYSGVLPKFRRLFKQYDVIQGYSTDPIWPLLAGEAYFAFEHGTLRDIPFEEDSRGRLSALAYRRAEHVFVTNMDCLKNARRLAGKRVTFINHPWDEDHGLKVEGVEEKRREWLSRLNCERLFFFPTRQDWVPDTGFADKGNDVFLKAFAKLRQRGHSIGLICCNWGSNVEQSRLLLADLNCSDAAVWVEPMGCVEFDRTIRASDLVVDQFKLGAFGGVLFIALANGTPVCTYLDKDAMGRNYPEPPPVVNGRTPHAISSALERLLLKPHSLEKMGQAGRKWIKDHHNSLSTVEAQVQQYMRFLERQEARRLSEAPRFAFQERSDGAILEPDLIS